MAKTHNFLKSTSLCCTAWMYSHSILDCLHLVSHFQHWQITFSTDKKKKKKKKKKCTVYILQSFLFHLRDLQLYETIQMESFAFMFSILLPFLKIKLLVKLLTDSYAHVSFIISIKAILLLNMHFYSFHSKQLVNSLKQVTNNTLMKINTCTKLVGHPFIYKYSNLSWSWFCYTKF